MVPLGSEAHLNITRGYLCKVALWAPCVEIQLLSTGDLCLTYHGAPRHAARGTDGRLGRLCEGEQTWSWLWPQKSANETEQLVYCVGENNLTRCLQFANVSPRRPITAVFILSPVGET